MNKRPVVYLQTDSRWKNKPYRVSGESSTIGSAGCGPTSAAMLIETITGKTYTPVDACQWSLDHGYKALNRGTYYSYFTPQFAEFGIDCQMLNWTNLYGNPTHPNHYKVVEKLKEGYYAIAVMGKGLWTSSGHFVVVWWQDNKVRINDPNSTSDSRTNGDIWTFRSQVKYYWLVDARNYNKGDDEDMTEETFYKMFISAMNKYRGDLQDNDASSYSKEAREWAKGTGLVAGGSDKSFNGMWEDFISREQVCAILYRFAKSIDKA